MSERTWVFTGIGLLAVLLLAGWVLGGGFDSLDPAAPEGGEGSARSVDERVTAQQRGPIVPTRVAQAPAGLAQRLRGGAPADPTLALATFDAVLAEYTRLATVATERAAASPNLSARTVAAAQERVEALVGAHRTEIEQGRTGRAVARSLVRTDWEAFVDEVATTSPAGPERDAVVAALREVGGPVSAP